MDILALLLTVLGALILAALIAILAGMFIDPIINALHSLIERVRNGK